MQVSGGYLNGLPPLAFLHDGERYPEISRRTIRTRGHKLLYTELRPNCVICWHDSLDPIIPGNRSYTVLLLSYAALRYR